MINIVCINTTNFKSNVFINKKFKFKTRFLFLFVMHFFSCKVVTAKFQSLLDKFYSNLTVKNNLHCVVVVQYLETEEILYFVVLNFITLYAMAICHVM